MGKINKVTGKKKVNIMNISSYTGLSSLEMAPHKRQTLGHKQKLTDPDLAT